MIVKESLASVVSRPRGGGLIVLEIPALSSTLHFRAYAERIGSGSILDWAIERLLNAVPSASPVCVLVDHLEADRVERAMRAGTNATVWRASVQGNLYDLAALARTTGKAQVLLVSLAAAVLPIDVFRRLTRHHAAVGNHATILASLPCNVAPILVQSELLFMLDKGSVGMPPDLLPRDLRSALAGLQRAMQVSDQCASLRLERLAPIDSGEQARRRWPYAVSLGFPADAQVLRRVLRKCAGKPDDALRFSEPLDWWTEVSRDQRRRILADAGRHACIPRDDRDNLRRVLYVQNASAYTGVEQLLVVLAEQVRRKLAPPFEIAALMALPGTLTDRLAEAGADVHIAQFDFAQGSVEHYQYCGRMLRAIRPAVVHVHALAGLPFSCAVAELGLPFVQHVHVASETALNQLSSQIMSASAVIAISDFVKRRLIRLGVDPDRLHVIRNGVHVAPTEVASRRPRDEAAHARMRRTFALPTDAHIVLMPARFAANKRHDVALEAFSRLRAKLPGAHLVLAGEAFTSNQAVLRSIEGRIDRLRLRDSVRRLGFWADMPGLYSASDVLLLPSDDDPLPLTVLEGMAAGLPVIAARSGGTPEMIEDGVSGLLVEPGDADSFARALAQVLTEDELRTKLIAGGLARCRTEFSLSRFVNDVGRVYERVLAGEPATACDVESTRLHQRPISSEQLWS